MPEKQTRAPTLSYHRLSKLRLRSLDNLWSYQGILEVTEKCMLCSTRSGLYKRTTSSFQYTNMVLNTKLAIEIPGLENGEE